MKQTGWINIIPWFDYARIISTTTNIYKTKEEALAERDTEIRYIGDPIQISWEE